MLATRITFKRIGRFKDVPPITVMSTRYTKIEDVVFKCLATMRFPVYRVRLTMEPGTTKWYAFMESGIIHPIAEFNLETIELEGVNNDDSDYWEDETVI